MGKKILALLALCAVVTLAAPAWAQSLGSPITLTPKGEFGVGLSASYLFEQPAEDFDTHGVDNDGGFISRETGKIKNDQLYLLELAYGVTNWLNVFAQAGVAHGGKFIENHRDGAEDWECDLANQFVWAVGAKGRLLKLDNGLALGLSARYLRYDNRDIESWHETISNQGVYSGWSSTSAELDYWQVDVTAVASLPLGPLTPYAGLGYSHWEAKEHDNWIYNPEPQYFSNYEADLKSQEDFLVLCGVELALGHGLAAYVQAEFFARSTLGLGLSWSF